MNAPSKILVAGVGNIFLGDDAFGVEVVRRLRSKAMPSAVEIVDFGIRGFDLASALANSEAAIVVDAIHRGGAPGTLYVIEPRVEKREQELSPHALTPDRVLEWLAENAPPLLRVVGCEPGSLEPDPDGCLTATVDRAAQEAVEVVESLARAWLDGATDA